MAGKYFVGILSAKIKSLAVPCSFTKKIDVTLWKGVQITTKTLRDMPQWTSERNWSANVFQETYARMMKALKNAHQQNGLAALHASSMPGLRHNNNNDDKYREEIVGYFAFLCVWHRFVELVMRGKCKRYSKYNWRFSFHASNTSWILALKIFKNDLFSIWLNFSEENWKWNWKQNCTEKCSVDGIIWQVTEASTLVLHKSFFHMLFLQD